LLPTLKADKTYIRRIFDNVKNKKINS